MADENEQSPEDESSGVKDVYARLLAYAANMVQAANLPDLRSPEDLVHDELIKVISDPSIPWSIWHAQPEWLFEECRYRLQWAVKRSFEVSKKEQRNLERLREHKESTQKASEAKRPTAAQRLDACTVQLSASDKTLLSLMKKSVPVKEIAKRRHTSPTVASREIKKLMETVRRLLKEMD